VTGIHIRERAPVAPSPARGLAELVESGRADLVVIGSSRHAADGRIRRERSAGRLLQRARMSIRAQCCSTALRATSSAPSATALSICS
jgi:hypothetical protein